MPSILPADRNRPEVVGMKLPALQLSKNLVPETFRGFRLRGSRALFLSKKCPIKYETRRRAPGTTTPVGWFRAMLNSSILC